MFLIIAISILVIGILMVISIIAFYEDKKGNPLKNNNVYTNGKVSVSEDNKNTSNIDGSVLFKDTDKDDYTRRAADYLPVLNKTVPLSELERELVHFEGKGIFYQIEADKELLKIEDIDLKDAQKLNKIEGRIFLTSKWIILINEHTKKIALRSIEDYRFVNGVFIIKRKRVKKKKDIFQIIENPAEFYYITKVLLKNE